MSARVLTVLSRNWCHLCEEIVRQLSPLAVTLGWKVEVIDVDLYPELAEKWDELIPVILHGDYELCHYRLNEEAIRAYCACFPLKSDI